MRTVLLTSDSLRHRFLAENMARETDLQLIVTEEKSAKITSTSAHSEEDSQFLREHFARRAASEADLFKDYSSFPAGTPLLPLEHGRINSYEVFKRIVGAAPDIIVLFGTSIIKDPLLKEFNGRIINLHLGLSPYYRGSATNLYPYLFDEPECVGATIHLATSEVDKGGILHQLRPALSGEDDLHRIGNRIIKQASEVLPMVLKNYFIGEMTPVMVFGEGKVCRNKDISPAVLRKIYQNFDQGMIPRYLEEKDKRDTGKPIVKMKEI